MNPELLRIAFFPIKSLDGIAVEAAMVLAGRVLAFDRRWRMVDRQGRTVNGKRTTAVHRVAARFDVERQLVGLDVRGGSQAQGCHLVSTVFSWIGNAPGQFGCVVHRRPVNGPTCIPRCV